MPVIPAQAGIQSSPPALATEHGQYGVGGHRRNRVGRRAVVPPSFSTLDPQLSTRPTPWIPLSSRAAATACSRAAQAPGNDHPTPTKAPTGRHLQSLFLWERSVEDSLPQRGYIPVALLEDSTRRGSSPDRRGRRIDGVRNVALILTLF